MPDQSILPSFPAPLRPDIAALETSGIAEVFAQGFGREDLVPLWVGEGDRPTPPFICDAAAAALKAGETFYTHKRGIPELRQAIADYTAGLYDVTLDLERISVTSSGMTGVVLILQALAAAGDNVVVVDPIWPNITAAVGIAGAELRRVSLEPQDDGGFRLDLDRLEAALDGRTRAIFIASPGNPTGWVMSADEQRAVLELCRARRIWYLADEVYARFLMDQSLNAGSAGRLHAPSLLQFAAPDDPVIVLNSFSKAWAMTGWRLGWVTHPPALADTFDRLIEFTTSGAQAFLQRGAVAALTEGEAFVKENVAGCRRGGALVYEALADLPRLRLARPQGAFYSFIAVDGITDSLAEAKRILAETGVGLAPGSAFGDSGEGHLRLCFASSEKTLAEGLERLRPILR